MTAPPVRVALVEDHEMMLDGLIAALAVTTSVTVVASARSVAEFRSIAKQTEAAVVVSDLALPDGSGKDIASIASLEIGAPTLLMTGLGDREGVSAAIESACAGFVSKGASLDQLVTAIHTAASGGSVFPAALLRETLSPDLTSVGATLSEREREVLAVLAEGRSASEIATGLDISIHTARNHIRSILTKLHARSQLEAVVLAVRSGIVQIR